MEINNFKRVITEKILYIIEYKWQKRTKCLHFVICRKQFLLFRTYLLEGDFGALLPVFSPKKHSIRIGRNQLKKLFHPDDIRKRKNTDPRRFFITKEKQQHSLNNIPSKKYKFFSIFSRKDAEVFLYCYITNFTATQRFFSRWWTKVIPRLSAFSRIAGMSAT